VSCLADNVFAKCCELGNELVQSQSLTLHAFPAALFTDTAEHIRLLLFQFSVFPLFICRFRAVDQADSCQLLSAR